MWVRRAGPVGGAVTFAATLHASSAHRGATFSDLPGKTRVDRLSQRSKFRCTTPPPPPKARPRAPRAQRSGTPSCPHALALRPDLGAKVHGVPQEDLGFIPASRLTPVSCPVSHGASGQPILRPSGPWKVLMGKGSLLGPPHSQCPLTHSVLRRRVPGECHLSRPLRAQAAPRSWEEAGPVLAGHSCHHRRRT